MAKKKPWHYASASAQRCGTMMCTVCNKEITQGDYRYRGEWDDKGYYAHQHRGCVPLDQQEYWLHQEEKQRLADVELIKYREACKVFRDTWKTDALDQEIFELRYL